MRTHTRIIGLGTGRCGTRSLVSLLNAQRDVMAWHERPPALAWENETDPGRHLRRLDGLKPIVADVGFYYLPHVDALREEFPGVRFACLRRDCESTVRSFCSQLPRSLDWFGDRKTGWSRSFPTIPKFSTFASQVEDYWWNYYTTAARLEGDDFRIFEIDALNEPADTAELLEFCGIADPVIEQCHQGAGC